MLIFRCYILLIPYTTCLSLFDFFHWELNPPDPLFSNRKVSSFLQLSSIPVCVCVCVCVCVYHMFFIYSFVDGNLGCFHILSIVNNAPINIEGTSKTSIFIFLCIFLSCHIFSPNINIYFHLCFYFIFRKIFNASLQYMQDAEHFLDTFSKF